MKLLARKEYKTKYRKPKLYSILYSRNDGKTRMESFTTIDEALDAACSISESLTFAAPPIAERARETNHRVLNKNGFQEFCSN